MFSIKRTPEKEPCYTDFSGVLCILWKNSCKQKNDNKLKCKDYIKIIVKASFVWIIGYGITWLSKWIIYDVIYNEGLIKSAISQVRYNK